MNIPDRCVDRLLFRGVHVQAASLIVMPAMALPFNARAWSQRRAVARDNRRQVEYRSVRTRFPPALVSTPRCIAIPRDVRDLTSMIAETGM